MSATNRIPTDLPGYVEYGWRLGWSFTPLSGKRPILKGWQSAPRETLEQALKWAAEGNVGLRTGRASGMVAVDVDPGGDVSALGLPRTVRANTGREGASHVYLGCRYPIGNFSGKLGPHIDFKGDGGQIVFPGSVHPETGKRYEWAEGCAPWEVELAGIPVRFLAKLTGPPKSPPNAKSGGPPHHVPPNGGRYAAKALQAELDAVVHAEQGERNDTLNRAAFNLGQLVGGGYLDRGEVETALLATGKAVGLDDREVEATVRSGLASGAKRPRKVEPKAPQTPKRRGGYILIPGAHKDDAGRYIERSNAEFAGEVLSELPPDAIYRKDFIPGELLGPAGKRSWAELMPDRMRLAVDSRMKLGKWVTSRQSKEQAMLYQPCGKDAAGVAIAHARQAEGVRELDLMVGYPVYGPGFVRIEPGWRDGLYYDEPPELAGLEPERDIEVIHGVLDELVVDFPFKTDADRENFLGLLLTPIVGPALDGSRPMHLVNSPLERTGKSKLVNEVFGGVLIGRQTPSMQITEREEEREKRILAMLLQGETLMHLDNLPHYIDSASLSSLLTAHVFGGRVLGVSRTVKLANHLTIVGTGNNVAASGEIAKRIVPVLIEPTSAHPEARSDFEHPDLRAYVRGKRRVVLECLLGLVEIWLAVGRPKHPNRLGGFESWSETVGGVLAASGYRAWRTNEADWRKLADPQGAEMESFVRAWHEAYGAADVAPKELRDLAEENELFGYVFAKRSQQAVSVAFGRMLRRHADMPVGEWFIRSAPYGNGSRYRLEEIE